MTHHDPPGSIRRALQAADRRAPLPVDCAVRPPPRTGPLTTHPPPRTGPETTHPPPLTTHPPHRQRCHPVAQPCTRSDPILALPPSRYPAAFRAAERSHLPRGPGAAVDPETPRRLARGLLGDSPLSSFWRGLLERYLAPAAPAPRRPAPSEAPGWAAAGGGEGSGPPDVMRMRSAPGVLRGWKTPLTSDSTTTHYYALRTTH